jgi:hypothetical protein
MTISIEFADGKGGRTPGEDVATNRGWAEFGAWVDDLPVDDDHRCIGQLWEYGATGTAQQLADQLKKAIKTSKPPKDVKSIAENLITLCSRNAKSGGVFVADDS